MQFCLGELCHIVFLLVYNFVYGFNSVEFVLYKCIIIKKRQEKTFILSIKLRRYGSGRFEKRLKP